MHIELALDHAVVLGLGRYAGKDVERWDAEKGAFMSDHGAQSNFEKVDEVPSTAAVQFLIHDWLPVLSNAVAKPTEHLEAQPPNGKPLCLLRFLEHHILDISASSAPGAERGTGSGALQTHFGLDDVMHHERDVQHGGIGRSRRCVDPGRWWEQCVEGLAGLCWEAVWERMACRDDCVNDFAQSGR